MTNPMEGLYARLRKRGMSESFVRSVGLPDWWDDEAAMTPAGYAEALGYISSRLGIPMGVLRAREAWTRDPDFQGVFQVQRCGAGEGNRPDGPWSTEKRFKTWPEAQAYIKATPQDWTSMRVFCDPAEVADL